MRAARVEGPAVVVAVAVVLLAVVVAVVLAVAVAIVLGVVSFTSSILTLSEVERGRIPAFPRGAKRPECLPLTPKINSKNLHIFHPPKHDRQQTSFTTLFTTSSPQFTINLHTKIPKNPCKTTIPPQQKYLPLKSNPTGCIIQFADDFVPS